MKNLFTLIVLFASMTASAHNKKIPQDFIIRGTIKGLKNGTAILQYEFNGVKKTLATTIRNTSFVFRGHLSQSQQVLVILNGYNFNGSIAFFAENSKIVIEADTSNLLHPSIKGSNAQEEFEEYQQKVTQVDEDFVNLNETGKEIFLSGKMTDQIKDSLFNVQSGLEYRKYNVIETFTKEHPSSVVSAWAIIANLIYDPKPEILEPLFETLTPAIQAGIYGKQILMTIEVAKGTAIGRQAINFRQKNANGKFVSLSSFRGKYLLVDFWASWCGPCRAENPNIVRLYNEFKYKDFDVLGVSLDNSRDAWLHAVSVDHLTWTEVCDLTAWHNSTVKAYGIRGIPFNLLLDKNGKIIAKNLFGKALEDKIREVLN